MNGRQGDAAGQAAPSPRRRGRDATRQPVSGRSAGPVAHAYLGLGSNLGDRAANLWEAARLLGSLPSTRLRACSRLYESEPVGPVPQGWFVNAVVSLDTELAPTDLLVAAKTIEREMGRAPSERWGPRLIDVDILLYGDELIASSELALPHPELWNRRFVLIPLRDVLPGGALARRVERRLRELDTGRDAVRIYEGSVR